jgi:hypothetical protein
MSTTYDKAYFIAKFSAIPDELWGEGSYGNMSDGPACAMGHCMRLDDLDGAAEHTRKLAALFPQANEYISGSRVIEINDGSDPRYQQPTPKARILAALADLP